MRAISDDFLDNTSLAAPGALAHCLKNPKWPLGLERYLPLGFGHSRQVLTNKFFDASTPSMRKGHNRGGGGRGGKTGKRKKGEKKKKKIITFLVATYFVASRPPKR